MYIYAQCVVGKSRKNDLSCIMHEQQTEPIQRVVRKAKSLAAMGNNRLIQCNTRECSLLCFIRVIVIVGAHRLIRGPVFGGVHIQFQASRRACPRSLITYK